MIVLGARAAGPKYSCLRGLFGCGFSPVMGAFLDVVEGIQHG